MVLRMTNGEKQAGRALTRRLRRKEELQRNGTVCWTKERLFPLSELCFCPAPGGGELAYSYSSNFE